MSWRKVLVVAEAAAALAIGCSSDAPGGLGRGGDFGDTGGSPAMDAGIGGKAESGGKGGASSGGKSGANTGGNGTGGKGGASTGTGGANTGAGGKGGVSTGGSGTGGKGGASTGGKGGSSGASTGGQGGARACKPDPALACDNCIETKCCQEWLDCVNDADCFTGSPGEFVCIQDCLINDGSSFPSIDECAASCRHDSVGVSAATSSIIACMRDTGDAGTQNCTNECFGREI